MMRRWVRVAFFAGCLGFVQAARAQYPETPPGQAGLYPFANVTGAARAGLPEPAPIGAGAAMNGPDSPGLPPNSTTLPKTPAYADPITLPNDSPGAFPTKTVEPEEACYWHLGYMGLIRQGLIRNGPLAVQDPQDLDTGNPPPAGQPVIEKLGDIHSPFQSGVRSTVGLLLDSNQFLEVSGFYVFQGRSSVSVTDPGQVDLPFINPPLGFEGDNGMWLQADRSTTTLTSSLWDVEVNYRWAEPGITGADLITGVRLMDLTERLSTYTDDDGIQFPMTNGLPDPVRVATYSVQTQNRLLGPQSGFEWDQALTQYLSLGLTAKGVWGADFVDLNRRLVRGDGYVGFNDSSNAVQFSQSYELNAFIDVLPLERLKIHVGYAALWMVDVPTVVGQYDFNLQNTNSFNNRTGSIFFHGPVVEIQMLF